MMLDGAAVGQFGDAGVLLHRDAGEIRDLLAQSGEPIEERGLAGVRRPDQRDRLDGTRRGRELERPSTVPQPWQSPHSLIQCLGFRDRSRLRTFRRRAVSRRSAISEPSTWKTRGSPPGALKPAVIARPGQETQAPSGGAHRRPARSIRSRMAASPLAEVHQGGGERFRLAAVATQLHHGFSMRRSEILVNTRRCFSSRFFPAHWFQAASKCTKIKDNRMTKHFTVRRIRLADLDRILQIEHASFGKDAYDRNLFAEYSHKCGDLFLVAASGPRAFAVICVTCIGGERAEMVSIAVDPAARGKGAASAS